MKKQRGRVLSAVACWLLAAPVMGAEAVDYARQIKPVLRERCYACHGALKQESGLRLDTAALVVKGGDSGAAIQPGNAAASLLLARVSAPEMSERMPPEGEPLTPAQIKLIESWIAEGAHGPAGEQPQSDPRDHWAFKTPVRPAVPQVKDAQWSQNPIDAFIAAEHERRGLARRPPADKRVWLRRIYLDLVGLPPTRAEQDAFVADPSPQAYETVVTRLLDSPQYGERWGRHWMDIWRYSDWWGLGTEVRNSQKHIWHWRDWIIESLNADKGYNQMLLEMLAADELYPNDLDRLRASGFLARQYFKFNRTTWLDETVEHTSKAMLGLTFNCSKCHDHKYDPIAQTDYYHLRAVFEPYQVRTDLLPGEYDFERDGIPRAFDCNLDAQTHLHIRGDDRNPDKTRALGPAVPAFLSAAGWKIEPVTLPPEAFQPGLRPFVLASYMRAAEEKIADARAALDKARMKAEGSELAVKQAADQTAQASGAKTDVKPDAKPAAPQNAAPATTAPQVDPHARLALVVAETALAVAEAQPAAIRARAAAEKARHAQPPAENAGALAREAVKLERTVAAAKADEAVASAELDVARAAAGKKAEPEKKLVAARTALDAARKAIETPDENFTPLAGALKMYESNLEGEDARRKPFPRTSTGRRTAFAKWLTDPKHPLAARVAVNHIWGRHFGRPLVATVFDFGHKGALPTHPELLDWLAIELIEHGWSMKHIHRLIVTSQTYRLTSSAADAAEATLAGDPENKFYWRTNPVRMEAQTVRDSLLHLAGELDLARGGPSIPPNNEAARRRSLYFVHSHNEHDKFLSSFDDAGVQECYRRAESIVPQQALALENSQLATLMGDKIAQRIAAAAPGASDQEFIRAAFLTVLSVEPSQAERDLAATGLARLLEVAKRMKRPNPEAHARAGLVHALINHNDFLTVR